MPKASSLRRPLSVSQSLVQGGDRTSSMTAASSAHLAGDTIACSTFTSAMLAESLVVSIARITWSFARLRRTPNTLMKQMGQTAFFPCYAG